MICELCAFTDHRRYRIIDLHWKRDGIPLFTAKAHCPECGWWQAVWQEWAAA